MMSKKHERVLSKENTSKNLNIFRGLKNSGYHFLLVVPLHYFHGDHICVLALSKHLYFPRLSLGMDSWANELWIIPGAA